MVTPAEPATAARRPAGLPADVHQFTLVAPGIAEIEAGAAPTSAFRALTDIDGEYLLETLGDQDLLGDPDTRLRTFADGSARRTEYLIAARGPAAERLAAAGTGELPAAVAPGDQDPTPAAEDVVGYLRLDLDLLDNTHSCAVEVFVREPWRGRGIGGGLWETGTDLARGAGRSLVQAWVDHATPEGAADVVEPTRSEGAIALDRPARFALSRGLVLEQVERHSVLHVAGRAEQWRTALSEALTTAGREDEVVTWAGATPPELREHIAELMRRMSTDIPLGGLDWEEEAWDAERVRTNEASVLASGRRTFLTTAVRDRSTGVLVGFTRLTIPAGRPAAWQEDTIVMKEHRGRRIGTVLKLANQLALLEQHPDALRIHTWNAYENRHMLDVNHAVGFELASLHGAWQGRLD